MDERIGLDRRSFLARLGSMMALLFLPGLNVTSKTDQGSTLRSSSGRLGDIREDTIFDVCIIGSGFAGAVLGDALVKYGIKTVILESGHNPDRQSRDPRFRELEVFKSSGPVDYPVASTRFRGVGGTSWLWAGNCPRLHPMDFENNPYAPAGAAWPITYGDLDTYYEEAEKALRVRGGRQAKYHPPQKNKFPLPPDRDHTSLKSMLNKAGVIVSDPASSTPTNRSVRRNRYGPGLRVARSHLPRFQASPYGALIREATVTRLLVDRGSQIVGAKVKDLDRNVRIVRAHAYVVACGGLESPRLLLLSRSPEFPNGVGNNHGWVGRCFMEHRGIFFHGKVKAGWNNFNLYQLQGRSFQFYKQFKQEGLGGIIVNFQSRWIKKNDLYQWELGRLIDGISKPSLKISVETEMQPRPENRVTLDREIKDYFGNPVTNLFLSESKHDVKTIERAKRLVRKIYADLKAEEVRELGSNWGHHHMGTCRMGDNPRTSVVDRNLRVHRTRNLFVAGSSVFVTSGASNPTLTLTALSLRLADYIRSQLQDGALNADRRNWLASPNLSSLGKPWVTL